MSEDARDEAAGRIQREIELLRARVRTSEMAEESDGGGDGAGVRRVVRRDGDEVAS